MRFHLPHAQGMSFPLPHAQGMSFPFLHAQGMPFPLPNAQGMSFLLPHAQGMSFPLPHAQGMSCPLPNAQGFFNVLCPLWHWSPTASPFRTHTLHHCPFQTTAIFDMAKVLQFPGHNAVYEPVFFNVNTSILLLTVRVMLRWLSCQSFLLCDLSFAESCPHCHPVSLSVLCESTHILWRHMQEVNNILCPSSPRASSLSFLVPVPLVLFFPGHCVFLYARNMLACDVC
ncbi:hypothetical protein BsWGS_16822 [Bradybaena similaris]